MLLFVINQRKTMKDVDINNILAYRYQLSGLEKVGSNGWRYKLYKHLKKQELKLKQ